MLLRLRGVRLVLVTTASRTRFFVAHLLPDMRRLAFIAVIASAACSSSGNQIGRCESLVVTQQQAASNPKRACSFATCTCTGKSRRLRTRPALESLPKWAAITFRHRMPRFAARCFGEKVRNGGPRSPDRAVFLQQSNCLTRRDAAKFDVVAGEEIIGSGQRISSSLKESTAARTLP